MTLGLLLLLLSSPARGWESASTSGTSSDGSLTLSGVDGDALHTHGGAPARLGSARFRVRYAGEAPLRLTVTKIAFLTGHSCEAPPATVRSEPALGGLFLEHGVATESALALQVAPGTDDTLLVGFPAVDAYMAWCDRFAFQVTFRAGDEPLAVTAETVVTREEPMPE